jgi:hypothetical protein
MAIPQVDQRILIGLIVALVISTVYLSYNVSQTKIITALNKKTTDSEISTLTTWKDNHPISQVVHDACMSKHKEADAINNMKFSDPNIKKYVDDINVILFDLLVKNKELLCKNKEFIKSMILELSMEMDSFDYGELCSKPISEFANDMKKKIQRNKSLRASREIYYKKDIANQTIVYENNSMTGFDNNGDMIFPVVEGMKMDKNAVAFDRIMYESQKITQTDKLELAVGMLSVSIAKKFCKDGIYKPALVVVYLNKLVDEFCSSKNLEYTLKQNYKYLMNHLAHL